MKLSHVYEVTLQRHKRLIEVNELIRDNGIHVYRQIMVYYIFRISPLPPKKYIYIITSVINFKYTVTIIYNSFHSDDLSHNFPADCRNIFVYFKLIIMITSFGNS